MMPSALHGNLSKDKTYDYKYTHTTLPTILFIVVYHLRKIFFINDSIVSSSQDQCPGVNEPWILFTI